jgi:hypothetical protein
MPEPLSDDEVADLLHRMAFDLQGVTGATTRGDTAIQASRAALLMFLAALIRAQLPEPSPPPPPA